MGYWNSRGLRGRALEDILNYTHGVFMQKGLAVIQKVPTPITPVKISSDKKTITLAYFDQKSTVDYIGVIQGIPVCFDAKETGKKHLPLQNIHKHQIEFMDNFHKQKGVSFLLVHFTFCDEYYLLPFETLFNYWELYLRDGRKSIPYSAFSKTYLIQCSNSSLINYLEALNLYLISRRKSN